MSIRVNNELLQPTVFPDGTSQVWKLPDYVIQSIDIEVLWQFESEAEVFQLVQLATLLNQTKRRYMRLHMPFLPYGRQDKEIANDSCFAKTAFMSVLATLGFSKITTIDAHSPTVGIESIYPYEAICYALSATESEYVCFPDKGASARYSVPLSMIILGKDRDPLTGEVRRLVFKEKPIALDYDSESHILIVDDICDGGRTFIEAAKLIHSAAPKTTINLYVSHGIFSKGLRVLRDAGITRIFTKDGEVT